MKIFKINDVVQFLPKDGNQYNRMGGRLLKNGNISNKQHKSWFHNGSLYYVRELRDGSCLISNTKEDKTDPLYLRYESFTSVSYDEIVFPYEKQENPELKEQYDTTGEYLTVKCEDYLEFNDVFGKSREYEIDTRLTDYDIEKWKRFINKFGNGFSFDVMDLNRNDQIDRVGDLIKQNIKYQIDDNEEVE